MRQNYICLELPLGTRLIRVAAVDVADIPLHQAGRPDPKRPCRPSAREAGHGPATLSLAFSDAAYGPGGVKIILAYEGEGLRWSRLHDLTLVPLSTRLAKGSAAES